jgi:hypothetical protein
MSEQIYRVDKFRVPEPARGEFLSQVHATHAVLRCQPGFVRDVILEQTSGPGGFNFVTIVEWSHAAAMEPAREAVAALHRRMNIEPKEMLARLDIRADMANYRTVDPVAGQGR